VSTAKKFAGLLFRLAVIGLVAWGVHRTLKDAFAEWRQHGWSLTDLQWGWLAAACVLYVAGLLPAGIYWHRLLAALGVETRLVRALRAYYIGHLGKYVPGKAMVVLLRAGMVRARTVERPAAAVPSVSAARNASAEPAAVAEVSPRQRAADMQVMVTAAEPPSMPEPLPAHERPALPQQQPPPEASKSPETIEAASAFEAAEAAGPPEPCGVAEASQAATPAPAAREPMPPVLPVSPAAGIQPAEAPGSPVSAAGTEAGEVGLQGAGPSPEEHHVHVAGLSPAAAMARAATAVFYETFGMMAIGCALAAPLLLIVRARADLVAMAAAGSLLLGLPTLPGVLRWAVPWLRVLGPRAEAAAWIASVPVRVVVGGWLSMAGGWLLLGLSLWAVVRGVAGGVEVSWYEGWLASTATTALATAAGFLSLVPAGLVVREAVVLVLLVPLVGEQKALVASVLSRVVSVVAELAVSAILYPYAVDRDPRLQRSREPGDPVE
jgi:uncharacterized membrane protein YbhN (UPF0104 family)